MRVDRLVCALAGAMLLIGGSYADTANNSFASVSGNGVVADGESGFCIKNVEGAVEITVNERPGWKCEKDVPYVYIHNEGDVDKIHFEGRDDEQSADVAISNVWECVHEASNIEHHVSSPGAKDKGPFHMIAAYFSPASKGAALSFERSIVLEGLVGHHTNLVIASRCPNPKCDYGRKNPIDASDIVIDPSPVVARGDMPKGGILQSDGRIVYPQGIYKICYKADFSNGCEKCWFHKEVFRTIDVYKATSMADEYVGLDRTDSGYANEYTMSGSVTLKALPPHAAFEWNVGPNCEVKGSNTNKSVVCIVKRKAGDVPGGKDFAYSSRYKEERLSCGINIWDDHEPNCKASTTTTNIFTVVKVDVVIDGLSEMLEEGEGAFTYYVPDGDAPIWAEEWTNSLKDVSITCEPHDGEMAKQTVKLMFDDEFLWVEKDDGTVEKAKHSYTVKELNKTKFKLHGHKKSAKYKDKEIVAIHEKSLAIDKAKFTVFGRPWLIPDYDRKNGIDGGDIAKAKEGKTVFRFWINDDKDYGEDCPGVDYNSDLPGKGNNLGDSKVNGRRDLEDFTPIWIMHGKVKKEDGAGNEEDGEIWPDDTPPEFIESLTWKLESPHVNAVQTGMFTTEAGDFQHSPKVNCGNNMQKAIEEADIVKESFTRHFIEVMEQEPKKGVFIMEGAGAGSNLVLRITTPKGDTVTKASLPLVVSSVNDMYRWINLRGYSNDSSGEETNVEEPRNRPDAECDGKHIVFVHGFNTNAAEARSISAEMFKRLWQSGSNAMFTGVDWYADKGQFNDRVFLGTWTLEYYASVYHAFLVSTNLTEYCAKLPGTKVMMAHSLGNMMVSAAAKDHGLNYSKYFMINGAVAQEAFDKAQYEADMIDHEWEAGSGWDSEGAENLLKYRSSRWYNLFGNEYMFGNDDFRSHLSWKNRFKGVHDIINIYSETDEVVGNPTGWLDFESDSVWVLQERLKGTAKIYGTRPLGIFGQWLACEGGWGVNSYYAFDIRYYLRLGGFLRPVGSLSRDEVVLHPLFTPFDNEPEKMHSLVWFPFVEGSTEQYALRGLFLGDAIVAESHSMGANSLDSVDNIRMHEQMANKGTWPHTNSAWTNLWLKDSPLWYHADIKNLAYFYVYKVFDKMTKEME